MKKMFEEECPKLHRVLASIGKVDCLDANFEALTDYASNPTSSKFNYFGIELVTKQEIATDLIGFINNTLKNEPAFLRVEELNQEKNRSYRHYVDIVIREVEEIIRTGKFPKQPSHYKSIIERCESATKNLIQKMPKAIKNYRMQKCDRTEFESYQ